MNQKFKLFAICGPSGSGKNMLFDVLKCKSIFNPIKQYTTRPQREGEPKSDYNFINQKDFLYLKEQGKIICDTIFNNWYYGIDFESFLKDKINLTILNPKQILQINNIVQLNIIQLVTPDRERLIRCLKRGDDVDEVIRRYNADKKDFIDIENINCQHYYLSNYNFKDMYDNFEFITNLIERGEQVE